MGRGMRELDQSHLPEDTKALERIITTTLQAHGSGPIQVSAREAAPMRNIYHTQEFRQATVSVRSDDDTRLASALLQLIGEQSAQLFSPGNTQEGGQGRSQSQRTLDHANIEFRTQTSTYQPTAASQPVLVLIQTAQGAESRANTMNSFRTAADHDVVMQAWGNQTSLPANYQQLKANMMAYVGTMPQATFNCDVRAPSSLPDDARCPPAAAPYVLELLFPHHIPATCVQRAISLLVGDSGKHTTIISALPFPAPALGLTPDDEGLLIFELPGAPTEVPEVLLINIIEAIQKQAQEQEQRITWNAHSIRTNDAAQRLNPVSNTGGAAPAQVRLPRVPMFTPTAAPRISTIAPPPTASISPAGAVTAALAQQTARGRTAYVLMGHREDQRPLLGSAASDPRDLVSCFLWRNQLSGQLTPVETSGYTISPEGITLHAPRHHTDRTASRFQLALRLPRLYDTVSAAATCWLTANLSPHHLDTDADGRPRATAGPSCLTINLGGQELSMHVGILHRHFGPQPYIHIGGKAPRSTNSYHLPEPQWAAATIVSIRNALAHHPDVWAGLHGAAAYDLTMKSFKLQTGLLLHHGPAKPDIYPAPGDEEDDAAPDTEGRSDTPGPPADPRPPRARSLADTLAATATTPLEILSQLAANLETQHQAAQLELDNATSYLAQIHDAMAAADPTTVTELAELASAVFWNVISAAATAAGDLATATQPYVTEQGAPDELQAALGAADTANNSLQDLAATARRLNGDLTDLLKDTWEEQHPRTTGATPEPKRGRHGNGAPGGEDKPPQSNSGESMEHSP
ncbi:hypothetical protein HXX76_005308 [Chlamydomonas incerta]|uniref:Uncharacterized protein n=1 Tax=Chlamydomonas incerta TaxID=51695 RepID=A0A835T7B5_CHLIN|nr:hypothetical protein HXX76_005308 [Chlamydomonas incerta]|eukprot:KAG2438766.1 hypothetical protein HXX76_005308 [Chlamydomonas incerta]